MKPQNFFGTADFDDFLSQFEITCEINNWHYREKSLYLANCLTGDARSILCDLDHDDMRAENALVENRKENPQKLTQLSSRSHPRHLEGKRTA